MFGVQDLVFSGNIHRIPNKNILLAAADDVTSIRRETAIPAALCSDRTSVISGGFSDRCPACTSTRLAKIRLEFVLESIEEEVTITLGTE